MAKVTTQEILKEGFKEYKRTHNVAYYKEKAVRALIRCRTAALGGHVQSCPEGHISRVWYNSCKHRFCPLCCYTQIERWLIKQKARLLGCDYYHGVFTIPHELNIIWLYNEVFMTNLLFSTVRKILFKLLKDPKHLGAKPGIIATFQTWTQTLSLHPHIHCLITGGGLSEQRQWIKVSNGYLVPTRLVRARFRMKLIDTLRKAYEEGQIKLPAQMRPQKFHNLLNELKFKKKKWNVRIMERYKHGAGVATYLARYLRGGPISNSRIISFDGNSVTFSYRVNEKQDKRSKKEIMNLTRDQFIDRLLHHVPHRGMRMVRCWGLFANSKSEDLAYCRQLLGQPPIEDQEFLDWQSICEKAGNTHPEKCPVCGRILICTQIFTPDRLPPPLILERKAA